MQVALVPVRPSTSRTVLPVSGVAASWRAPTGREDAMLAEGRAEDPALALRLVRAIAVLEDEGDAGDLPVADFDALVCRIRASLLGDRVLAEVHCANPDCGEKIDIDFRLSDYLSHHAPRPARGAAADPARPGWHRLDDDEAIRFRLPGIADLAAGEQARDPARALALRCLDPVDAPAPLRRRAERAMATMAPMLAGPVQGACAECARPIAVHFAARTYCMQELCDRARFVFDDVDAIATRYHWSEAEILDLPASRRGRYADMARRVPVEAG
jgi:hypothetical protein